MAISEDDYRPKTLFAKLKGKSNWTPWRRSLLLYLREIKSAQYIGSPPQMLDDENAQKEWVEESQRIAAVIARHLDETVQNEINIEFLSAKELFDKLSTKYDLTDEGSLLISLMGFFALRMDANETVAHWVSRVEQSAIENMRAGQNVAPYIPKVILFGVTPGFDVIRSLLYNALPKNSDGNLNKEAIIKSLMDSEKQKEHSENRDASINMASSKPAQKKQGRKKPRTTGVVCNGTNCICNHCKKPNHHEDVCFSKQAGKPPAASKAPSAGKNSKSGTNAKNSTPPTAQTAIIPEHFASEVVDCNFTQKHERFLLDSGATHHIVTRADFLEPKQIIAPIPILFGGKDNNASAVARGVVFL